MEKKFIIFRFESKMEKKFIIFRFEHWICELIMVLVCSHLNQHHYCMENGSS